MHRVWTSRFSIDPDDRRPVLTVMDDFESLFPKISSIAKFAVEIECAVPYE